MNFYENLFSTPFDGQSFFPQERILPRIYDLATDVPEPELPSHGVQDPAKIAFFVQRSFPDHPGDSSAAKIKLHSYLGTDEFRANSTAADEQLRSRDFVGKVPSGGHECLWCRAKYSRPKSAQAIDAAVDCLRGHIGHCPYQCVDRCTENPQGCQARFSKKSELQQHQKHRRRGRAG